VLDHAAQLSAAVHIADVVRRNVEQHACCCNCQRLHVCSNGDVHNFIACAERGHAEARGTPRPLHLEGHVRCPRAHQTDAPIGDDRTAIVRQEHVGRFNIHVVDTPPVCLLQRRGQPGHNPPQLIGCVESGIACGARRGGVGRCVLCSTYADILSQAAGQLLEQDARHGGPVRGRRPGENLGHSMALQLMVNAQFPEEGQQVRTIRVAFRGQIWNVKMEAALGASGRALCIQNCEIGAATTWEQCQQTPAARHHDHSGTGYLSAVDESSHRPVNRCKNNWYANGAKN